MLPLTEPVKRLALADVCEVSAVFSKIIFEDVDSVERDFSLLLVEALCAVNAEAEASPMMNTGLSTNNSHINSLLNSLLSKAAQSPGKLRN